LYATANAIYEFSGWTGTNVTFGDAASRETDVVFDSGTSLNVVANYNQVNNQAGTYTIPEGDVLILPEGATITCNPGFRLSVAGKLKALGTLDSPITLTSDSPTAKWQGIYVEPGYTTDPLLEVELQYCRIENAYYGIEMSPNDCVRKLSIDHTVFVNNEWSGIQYSWFRDQTSSVTMDITITNCTFDNNGMGNLVLDEDLGLGGGPDVSNYFVTLRNNIFANGNVAVYGAGTVTEEYNDFFNSLYNTGEISSTSITADPLFVDAANGDYHLQENSPCIDAGNPDPQYNDPDGTRNDMGAYYYDAVPATPTGFDVSGVVGGHPHLQWDTITEADVTGVNVYRRLTDQGSGYSLIATVSVARDYYNDDEIVIASGGKFVPEACYRISAVDGIGQESDLTFPRCKPYGAVGKWMNKGIPRQYALHPAQPNPFNPRTTLRYDLPENSRVRLTLYDLTGRVVRTLVEGEETAGFKQAVWDGTDDTGRPAAAGVYLYTFQAEGLKSGKRFSGSGKLVLLK
jgi:hypothetical protein